MKTTLYTYANMLEFVTCHRYALRGGIETARIEYLTAHQRASWFRRRFDRRLRAWGRRTERLVAMVETGNEKEAN